MRALARECCSAYSCFFHIEEGIFHSYCERSIFEALGPERHGTARTWSEWIQIDTLDFLSDTGASIDY